MPITKLDNEKFSHLCANCEQVRDLSLSELTTSEDDSDTAPLRVPVCPKCGAFELLIPTQPDAQPHPVEGSYGHLHQLLVDELRDRRRPAAVARGKGKSKPPLSDLFPAGLVLAKPSEFRRVERKPESHD